MSAREFGLVGMDIPAGILVSKIGPKWTMVIGVAIFGVSAILAGISDNYWYLFAARLIAGGSFAIWSISRFTYLAANVPATSRGRAAALFGGTARAAGILGPVIGGFAAQEFGIRTPFFYSSRLGGGNVDSSTCYRTQIERGEKNTRKGESYQRFQNSYGKRYETLSTRNNSGGNSSVPSQDQRDNTAMGQRNRNQRRSNRNHTQLGFRFGHRHIPYIRLDDGQIR